MPVISPRPAPAPRQQLAQRLRVQQAAHPRRALRAARRQAHAQLIALRESDQASTRNTFSTCQAAPQLLQPSTACANVPGAAASAAVFTAPADTPVRMGT
jgi:hypothetical protein